jgi:hypothetical protein
MGSGEKKGTKNKGKKNEEKGMVDKPNSHISTRNYTNKGNAMNKIHTEVPHKPSVDWNGMEWNATSIRKNHPEQPVDPAGGFTMLGMDEEHLLSREKYNSGCWLIR